MMNPEAALLTEQQTQWLEQLLERSRLNWDTHSYVTPFNLLRWCHAYNGDIEVASRKLKRHLKIRSILKLDEIHKLGAEHGIDDNAEEYAPMTHIGQVSPSDPSPVLIERSGLFDLQAMMTQIRTTPFMMNRFRLMEKILGLVREAEQVTGRLGGAVLVLDLDGFSFSHNLISFISGTYRIMWGTLMEQYPFMFRKFVIINSPASMNILWSACSAFVPDEYKEKIFVHKKGEQFGLHQHVDPRHLPHEYHGHLNHNVPRPTKCKVTPLNPPSEALRQVSVPAAGYTVETYHLREGQKIEFYLKHSQEFTMNIMFDSNQDEVKDVKTALESFEEAFAGCERPALPTLDMWTWEVPQTGFYHVIYGNEKAWLMSVKLEYLLMEMHPNGHKIKVNPIKPRQSG